MTYQEVINEIRDLGFSDDDEMEEFGELVPNSINRAITEIAVNVAAETPHMGEYDFTIEQEDAGLIYIDMGEQEDFLSFAATPILYKNPTANYYSKFTDYEVMNENNVILDADTYKGDFRILYKMAHERFTGEESQLSEDVPLPLKYHFLVPLIAAYYVWLEDEPAKAAQYYNMYETGKTTIQAEMNRPKMRVLSGGM